MQKWTKNAALGAAAVQKPAPQALSGLLPQSTKTDTNGLIRIDYEKAKNLERLYLDFFTDLSYFGIFQYPFCLAGALLSVYSHYYRSNTREKKFLQQPVRKRTASCLNRNQIVPAKRYAALYGFQTVSLWFYDFLFYYVFYYALDNISCFQRNRKPAADCSAAVDIEHSLEFCLYSGRCPVDCPICFRILQHYADFHTDRRNQPAVFQTTFLVRFLPYGYAYPINLQSKIALQKHKIKQPNNFWYFFLD